MPVTAAQGLVGQVVEVAPNASKVRLITDRRSGVAAFVQRTRAAGIVQGSLEGALSLDFVDRKFKTQHGDVVVTSGIGGIYPEGHRRRRRHRRPRPARRAVPAAHGHLASADHHRRRGLHRDAATRPKLATPK